MIVVPMRDVRIADFAGVISGRVDAAGLGDADACE
jgi:hypothetical protein